MPLKQRGTIGQLEWCLWTFADNDIYPEDVHDGFLQNDRLNRISNDEVRAQYLAARMALQSLVGKQGVLAFSSNGKPSLGDSGSVSLSHTVGSAAACYHPNQDCGIDIELSNRVFSDRVIKRFAHPDEMEQLNQYGAVHFWCAKEAVYKANGSSGVHFNEHIRVSWHNDQKDVLYGVAKTHNKKIWNIQNRLLDGLVVSLVIPFTPK